MGGDMGIEDDMVLIAAAIRATHIATKDPVTPKSAPA
jgi:hypothetical protein